MNIKNLSSLENIPQFQGKAYTERNALRKVYKDLWKELNLPENLRPPLFFKSMLSKMCFSPTDYAIYVNKDTPRKTLDLRNKTGKNKATLRHEIEHVKQIWDIIRLKGAESVADALDIESKGRIRQFRAIERSLAKIDSNSEEAIRVEQYYKNLLNYPKMERVYGVLDVQNIIDLYKYYTNILEIDANKAEKAYRPSIIKTVKVYIKTFWEQVINLTNKNKN